LRNSCYFGFWIFCWDYFIEQASSFPRSSSDINSSSDVFTKPNWKSNFIYDATFTKSKSHIIHKSNTNAYPQRNRFTITLAKSVTFTITLAKSVTFTITLAKSVTLARIAICFLS
jgi:hypothetical protein